MARKRLNKKVALIGSMVFVLLALAAIGIILYLSQDAAKFIDDGDAAMLQKDYETAERSYLKARGFAKTDSLRIEIFFKLADTYHETERWRNVLGCWNKIIQLEPENTKARYGRLNYIYIVADSGVSGGWKEVETQASEFIEVADENLLADDVAKWESFPDLQEMQKQVVARKIGPYLYLLRARALLEMTRMGAVTNPDDSLARAFDDLEKVRELESDNVNAYWYLARATITKGQLLASRGDLEQREKSAERARKLLERAVEVAPGDIEAHVNLLTIKMETLIGQGADREQIETLESEYLALVEEFEADARSYSALAGFYQVLGYKKLDKAIETIEKAIELDKGNVNYAIRAADLHHRRFSAASAQKQGQKSDVIKAIELAQNALNLPDAQYTLGPRQGANRLNRMRLYTFLAYCYIEQILEVTDSQQQVDDAAALIIKAEQVVDEIEQLFGSGEEPQVIKWQGLLQLAKGDRADAVKKLYAAYEQLKASGRRDAHLSYTLAKLFGNTNELGAVNEFYISALSAADRSAADKIDNAKPHVFLEWAEVLLKMNNYNSVLNVINFFEKEYWSSQESQTLRIRTYIASSQFDKAEEELSSLTAEDPDTTKLYWQLVQAKVRQLQRSIAQRRMKVDLDAVLQPEKAAEQTEIQSQDADRMQRAELKEYRNTLGELANKVLQTEPNNTTALLQKKLLAEPEQISQQRRREIEEQVISGIDDPIRRAINLGLFYRRNNELEKAVQEFKKILVEEEAEYEESLQVGKTLLETPGRDTRYEVAAAHLFDIALEKEDWDLAEQIVEMGRARNLDGYDGKFFAARLAAAKTEYEAALALLDECLKQKPVFSPGLMLSSSINDALGNERVAIEDARRAAFLNPKDPSIARGLALVLYRRNEKLGTNVSSAQIIETRDALNRAIALNTGKPRLQLLSMYAEYISSTEPSRALAIRQSLQKTAPSVENALLLARMATRRGAGETDKERKQFLFDTAASAFEQALAIDPQNKAVLNDYAQYYQLTGQTEKAEQLLQNVQDRKLLYGHYFRIGQFDKAKQIMEQLYQANPKDPNGLKGLLLVAEQAGDREAVKKYSDELLLLEDNVVNHLFQVQTLLKMGLVKEADHKLQSLKEKFPDEAKAMLLEAWLAMKQGQMKKSLELTNRYLEIDQNSAIAWRLRGEINHLLANYEQAIIDLKTSKSLSDDPVVRIPLAKAYLRAGRREDAITELQNTVYHPQSPVTAKMFLEEVYQRLNRKTELRKFYDELIRRFPDDLLWYNRAGAFAVAEGDFARAEQLYEKAWQKSTINGNPNVAALDGYLRALILGQKPDKVFGQAAKYIDGDFAPVAYLRMAEAKAKMGDKAAAVQYCRTAVERTNPDQIVNSNILQRMRSILGDEEVLKYCKERLQAEPESLAANYTMFNLAKTDSQYNKAVEYIDKCIRIVGPDSPRRLRYIVEKTQVLQMAYERSSDNDYFNRAVTEYESLLAELPNNSTVQNNLAYLLAEENVRLDEALALAERAYGARPNNPDFLDTYAYVLFKNGKYSEAHEHLQSAVQQYEARLSAVSRIPPTVYEHLGMIEEKLGAQDKAIDAYKRALEIGADELPEAAEQRIKAAVERLSQQVKE